MTGAGADEKNSNAGNFRLLLRVDASLGFQIAAEIRQHQEVLAVAHQPIADHLGIENIFRREITRIDQLDGALQVGHRLEPGHLPSIRQRQSVGVQGVDRSGGRPWQRHVEKSFDADVGLLAPKEAFIEGEWQGRKGAVGFVARGAELVARALVHPRRQRPGGAPGALATSPVTYAGWRASRAFRRCSHPANIRH